MRLPIATLLLLAPTLLACTTRDDDYLLLRRVETRAAQEPTRLVPAAPNDGEALYVRQLLANGFGAELLRTYAMTKRFAARTADYHAMPTTIALGRYDGRSPVDPTPRRQVDIGWWRTTMADDQPIIWIDDSPERRDFVTMAKLVTAFGDEIVQVIAPETGGQYSLRGSPLRFGYITFLQVVAAEWRTPSLTDERDDLRRLEMFASVRGNAGVQRDHGNAGVMIGDPTVIATVLYRLASSDLSTRMADPAVYAPFLVAKPPREVHPALVLGAFRNFQAKLLAAWSRACASGRTPHDLIDLVEAYADAYPAERAEATRIFLITTYGATALHDGVRADAAPAQVETQLAALTADVLFGRRGLRDGFRDRR